MNKRHATMAGGIRRHPREEAEIDVVVDGLNLGRAMSFKNIAADLEFGGCKTTVQMDELDLDDLEALGFIAFALDRCRTMTGPDMNFPTAMSDVINKHFSAQFTNGPSSPLGESGKPTAYGTYLALKEAVRFTEGSDSLAGKSVAVMGLGAVGWYLADLLNTEGASLYVADVNTERVAKFISEHAHGHVVAVDVAEVLDLDAEILCPAAIGGIIDEGVISRLRYRYVFGPANNQLKATSQAEEERLARLLADRGILFQTEWWHNTAGVMCGAEEYINGANASYESLQKRIEQTIPVKTRANLEQARELGITPTENAYRTCADTIYGN
jgi:leucine dehydrogenase